MATVPYNSSGSVRAGTRDEPRRNPAVHADLFCAKFMAVEVRARKGVVTCRHSLQLHVVNEAHTDLLKKQGRYKLCTNDGEASRSAAV